MLEQEAKCIFLESIFQWFWSTVRVNPVLYVRYEEFVQSVTSVQGTRYWSTAVFTSGNWQTLHFQLPKKGSHNWEFI